MRPSYYRFGTLGVWVSQALLYNNSPLLVWTPDEIMAIPAVLHNELVDALCISHVDNFVELFEKWEHKDDMKSVEDLDRVIGRWWKTSEYNNRPVWRKESDVDVQYNNSDLFMFYHGDGELTGWVIAPTLLDVTDDTILAWTADKCAKDQTFMWPSMWHLPYWAKKKNHMVSNHNSC